VSLARVRVALLWHLHQPPGLGPDGGPPARPWARRQGLMHYAGLPDLLRETPGVRVTFSLTPALFDELEAAGAPERALRAAPADLAPPERRTLLRALVDAAALPAACRGRRDELLTRVPDSFGPEDWRDVQVLARLGGLDVDFRARDPRARALVERGRAFDEGHQAQLDACEGELLAAIVPGLRRARDAGQAELWTSAYDHAVLPLLCDGAAHLEAHPGARLARRHARPEQAARQVERAWARHAQLFGAAPDGFWPPEAALSEAVLACLARARVCASAGDEALLERSLGKALWRDEQGLVHPPEMLYRPWFRGASSGGEQRAREGQPALGLLFRDRQISDLIAFHYAGLEPQQAADDLLERLRRIGRDWRARGLEGEPVVGLALDGENPWRRCPDVGRRFLRALYRGLERDDELTTVTWGAALRATSPAYELPRLAAGSWERGDLSAWIGHPAADRAWAALDDARAVLERSRGHVILEAWRRAERALDAAGASDFLRGADAPLFRRLVEGAYRHLGLPAPLAADEVQAAGPTNAAGSFRPEGDGGEVGLVRGLHYAADGRVLRVRVETLGPSAHLLRDYQAAVAFVQRGAPRYRVEGGACVAREEHTPQGWLRLATEARAEVRDGALVLDLSLGELRARPGDVLAFRLSLLRAGLEVERHPEGAPLCTVVSPEKEVP
jgi:hypothetical protein